MSNRQNLIVDEVGVDNAKSTKNWKDVHHRNFGTQMKSTKNWKDVHHRNFGTQIKST